jgi:hypothetical protein
MCSNQFTVWNTCACLWAAFIETHPKAERIGPPDGMDWNYDRRLCFCVCYMHNCCHHLLLYIFSQLDSHTAFPG